MKVLMINGSPHERGCTYTGLSIIANELKKNGIESEIFHIGNKPISGCTACGKCSQLGKCIFDDVVNEAMEKASFADGFIFGSPVYYASANGSMVSFMDRLFYAGGRHFAFKPGAAIASARRGGTTATYDQLNKYMGISRMIMVPSQYWNNIHGMKPDDVLKDREGLQIMRTLGQNMAWMLHILENAKKSGIAVPDIEPAVRTNFI